MARFPIPGHPGGPPGAERPDRPFTGYKLARAVLSADCAKTAFAGLTLGAERVYGVTAEASCVWTPRHAPPRRWCGCGFYCLHDAGRRAGARLRDREPVSAADRGGGLRPVHPLRARAALQQAAGPGDLRLLVRLR